MDAFRYLASGKHVGKVLLRVRENEQDNATLQITAMPRAYCNPLYSYIIPGGLGNILYLILSCFTEDLISGYRWIWIRTC